MTHKVKAGIKRKINLVVSSKIQMYTSHAGMIYMLHPLLQLHLKFTHKHVTCGRSICVWPSACSIIRATVYQLMRKRSTNGASKFVFKYLFIVSSLKYMQHEKIYLKFKAFLFSKIIILIF